MTKFTKELSDKIREVLKPGTDRGSSMGVIDTNDIPRAAEESKNLFLEKLKAVMYGDLPQLDGNRKQYVSYNELVDLIK